MGWKEQSGWRAKRKTAPAEEGAAHALVRMWGFTLIVREGCASEFWQDPSVIFKDLDGDQVKTESDGVRNDERWTR